MVIDRSIDFLPDAKHLSIVMSAFADILGEAAWSHTQPLSKGMR